MGKVLFRPHYSIGDNIGESLSMAREFEGIGQLIETLVDEHNKKCPYFQIIPKDLCIYYAGADNRIGWNDEFIIIYQSYNAISNKEGYMRYFGEAYDTPVGVIGWFSTNYDKDMLEAAQ